MKPILIDIGNTTTVIACNGNKAILSSLRLTGSQIAGTVRKLSGGDPSGCAVFSSVVPSLNKTVMSNLRKCGVRNIHMVTCRSKLGVKIDYPLPGSIGADRLVTSTAAYRLYGGPVIVVDVGTATTFDCITKDGRFIGGIIGPGPRLITEYMHDRTALLPLVQVKGDIKAVPASTHDAMTAGTLLCIRGMIKEALQHLKRSMGRQTTILATGGYSKVIFAKSGIKARIEPDLVFKGLEMIGELNLK